MLSIPVWLDLGLYISVPDDTVTAEKHMLISFWLDPGKVFFSEKHIYKEAPTVSRWLIIIHDICLSFAIRLGYIKMTACCKGEVRGVYFYLLLKWLFSHLSSGWSSYADKRKRGQILLIGIECFILFIFLILIGSLLVLKNGRLAGRLRHATYLCFSLQLAHFIHSLLQGSCQLAGGRAGLPVLGLQLCLAQAVAHKDSPSPA